MTDPKETDSSAPTSTDPPAEQLASKAADLDSAITPDEIDREVEAAMSSMAAQDLAELAGEPPLASDSLEPGTELVGTVVALSGDDIFLEFGMKSQGVLPRSQFGKKEVLEIGRRVDVVVERCDAAAGLLEVSRKGTLQRATWTNLAKGMIVEGRVIGVNKGGLEVDLKGVRAFMPGSHVDVVPMKDISILLNETIRAEVIEVDRRSKNVLISRRKVRAKEQKEARAKLRSELAEGQVRRGIVRTITDYGAFVDLGGLDGLLHIGDLSWTTVNKVTDVLSTGQEIDVTILKIDSERDRISLGLKQSQPDPWVSVSEKFPVGTALKARILRITSFGAFAELEPGIDGLIPVSEMGWDRGRRPDQQVAVGDMVDCVVIRLELERRRLALSMKQAQPDPWAGVLEGFEEQSLVKGKVTRLTDFGAFVELSPGVEGLIHISELSEGRVKSCSDVVSVGQEVEMRILGVDGENRRIALSIKAVSAPAASESSGQREFEQPQQPTKRKKPLRGGLSSHYDW